MQAIYTIDRVPAPRCRCNNEFSSPQPECNGLHPFRVECDYSALEVSRQRGGIPQQPAMNIRQISFRFFTAGLSPGGWTFNLRRKVEEA
jgi:hypothetical protein